MSPEGSRSSSDAMNLVRPAMTASAHRVHLTGLAATDAERANLR